MRQAQVLKKNILQLVLIFYYDECEQKWKGFQKVMEAIIERKNTGSD